TRQQCPAANLVALPLADLGRGEVTDVVDVHHQEGTEVGFLQCRPRARQPVTVQAAVIHPLLEIDAHGAECRQRSVPVVARVDVLGTDDRGLSDRLGHLCLLGWTVRVALGSVPLRRAACKALFPSRLPPPSPPLQSASLCLDASGSSFAPGVRATAAREGAIAESSQIPWEGGAREQDWRCRQEKIARA